MLTILRGALLRLVFPKQCLLCERTCQHHSRLELCQDCKETLCSQQEYCSCCGCTLPHTKAFICGACLKKPPAFQALYFTGRYHAHLQKLIIDFKFHEKLFLSHTFALLLIEQMEEKIKNGLALPECIIPVPLHPKRLQERGFNQALEIAKNVARHFHLALDFESVSRVKNTLPQTTVKAKARHENVKNAFALTRKITYQHIAIIDDVVTTGSTIKELSALLKRAGVNHVEIWCIARA